MEKKKKNRVWKNICVSTICPIQCSKIFPYFRIRYSASGTPLVITQQSPSIHWSQTSIHFKQYKLNYMCISHDGHSRRLPRTMKLLCINHNCSFEKSSEKPFLWVIRFTSIKFFFLIHCHLQMDYISSQPSLTVTCWGYWNTVYGRQKPVCRALGEKGKQKTHRKSNTRCGLADGFLTKAIPHTATKKLFLFPIPYATVHVSHFFNHSRGNL